MIVKMVYCSYQDSTRDIRSRIPIRLQEFPWASPSETPSGKGLYLTVLIRRGGVGQDTPKKMTSFCTLPFALHCTLMPFTLLSFILPQITTLHCTEINFTALHCTAFYCTALHFTSLYFAVLDSTAQQCTFLACTAVVSQ